MQRKEKILDDLAQFAGGTVSIVSGVSHNIRTEIKSRVTEIVDRLDLAPRADVEALEVQIKALQDRIDALEKTAPQKKKAQKKDKK